MKDKLLNELYEFKEIAFEYGQGRTDLKKELAETEHNIIDSINYIASTGFDDVKLNTLMQLKYDEAVVTLQNFSQSRYDEVVAYYSGLVNAYCFCNDNKDLQDKARTKAKYFTDKLKKEWGLYNGNKV